MADDAEQHKKVKRVIGEIEAAETVEIEAAVIQKGAPREVELRLSLKTVETRKKFTDLIRTATLVVTPFGRNLAVSSPMYCIVRYKHEGKEKTLRVMGGLSCHSQTMISCMSLRDLTIPTSWTRCSLSFRAGRRRNRVLKSVDESMR